MSELEEQLLSTRLNQVYDQSAGHNDETASNEIVFDNPLDENAKNIILISSSNTMIDNKLICAWAILDDGPGVENINHLWGSGKGLKIKNSDKIGNKIAGAFAAAGYFNPDTLMYFSRKSNNNNGRKHQQMTSDFSKMIAVIKTKDIDMTVADNLIKKGHGKLVRIPEPSRDKFDSDDVEYVKKIFKNNTEICKYFDSEITGLMQIFIYEQTKEDKNEQKPSQTLIIEQDDDTNNDIIINERYKRFISELPKILDKSEFITYNTKTAFRGETKFEYIDVDNILKNRVINSKSCKKYFILGKKSINDEEAEDEENEVDEDEEADDEDEAEEAEEDEDEEDEDEEDEDEYTNISSGYFGTFNEKVLVIQSDIYTSTKGKFALCTLSNFSESFLINENLIGYKKYIKKGEKIHAPSGFKKIELIGTFYTFISIVSKEEANEQKDKMNLTKLEDLKQVYVYDNGRFLAKDKLPICGIQERSMPNFRIIMSINSETQNLINKRANKSSISLKDSDPIIKDICIQMIKPILNVYSSGKKEVDFDYCVANWGVYKEKILTVLGAIEKKIIQTPLQNSPQTTSQIIAHTPVQTQVQKETPSTIARSATEVYESLNKIQTINQLKRIKLLLRGLNPSIRTRGEKKKLLTKLYDIEREILLDDEILDEKIDNLIDVITNSENKGFVKHAASLQDIK